MRGGCGVVGDGRVWVLSELGCLQLRLSLYQDDKSHSYSGLNSYHSPFSSFIGHRNYARSFLLHAFVQASHGFKGQGALFIL